MPTNPILERRFKKIADLMQSVIVFYWRAADNERVKRLILNIVEESLLDMVNKVKKVIPEPPCPQGMVESGRGCIPG